MSIQQPCVTQPRGGRTSIACMHRAANPRTVRRQCGWTLSAATSQPATTWSAAAPAKPQRWPTPRPSTRAPLLPPAAAAAAAAPFPDGDSAPSAHAASPPAAAAAAGGLAGRFGGLAVATDAKPWQNRLGGALRSPHDKEIAAVAVPSMVGLMMEPLVGAFNAGLVGHLGTLQLGAVSLGMTALNSATFVFSFLMVLTVPEVAAALVAKDKEQVSRVTSNSLWLAAGCGLAVAALVGCNAQAVVAALRPPEPLVAALATQYIQIRALSVPCVMLNYVSQGVFRGLKDTRTPLVGTAASVAVSFVAHVVLLTVFHLGVPGAAAASAAASLASCGVLLGALVHRGVLVPRHLASPPPLGSVLPTLRRGAVLGLRNVVSFGMIIFASTISTRMGAAFQASFEVTRQLWLLTMPFYECFNVAAQALCASALGRQDRDAARAILMRLLTLGCALGTAAGLGVWAVHVPLLQFFTNDPLVIAHVMASLPLICLCFPLDAAGSILDGSLLAAKQSNYLSAVAIAGSAVQYGALGAAAQSPHSSITTLSIWAPVKVMSLARVLGGVARNFASDKSAYSLLRGAAAAAAPPAAAPPAAASAAAGPDAAAGPAASAEAAPAAVETAGPVR